MLMISRIPTAKTPETKENPYNDKTLVESQEFTAGKTLLESVTDDKLPPGYKKILSSPKGCYMLGHNPPLITIEQAAKLYQATYLQAVVSSDGIKALKDNIITMEKILSVSLLFTLQALLSKFGVMALKENLISVEQATDKRMRFSNLEAILSHNGLIALREGLITIKDVIEKDEWGGGWHILHLTTPEGMKALREGSITYADSQKMSASELHEKLGIQDIERHNISCSIFPLGSLSEKSNPPESSSSYRPGGK